MTCKCHTCKNLTKTIDEKEWVRYSCPFAPDKEWLGGKCDDPLKESCTDYQVIIKDNNNE